MCTAHTLTLSRTHARKYPWSPLSTIHLPFIRVRARSCACVCAFPILCHYSPIFSLLFFFDVGLFSGWCRIFDIVHCQNNTNSSSRQIKSQHKSALVYVAVALCESVFLFWGSSGGSSSSKIGVTRFSVADVVYNVVLGILCSYTLFSLSMTKAKRT